MAVVERSAAARSLLVAQGIDGFAAVREARRSLHAVDMKYCTSGPDLTWRQQQADCRRHLQVVVFSLDAVLLQAQLVLQDCRPLA